MKTVFLILLLCFSLSGYSQELTTLEAKLSQDYDRILYWNSQRGNDPYDSLEIANSRFKENLLEVLAEHSSSLHYAFPWLQERGINVVTSPDGNLRIYSWDTYTGGTMRFFESAYQFRGDSSVESGSLSDRYSAEDNPLYFCSEIFQMNHKSDVVYIAVMHAIYSSKDSYQGVKFFTINNNQFNDTIALIETEQGLQNEHGVSFDFFSVVDRRERPVKLIHYNPKSRTLKFPKIGNREEVKKGFIPYTFNGNHFVKK